jgi:maltose alpha-D-glucosyltransferase/alpha-amylase
LRGQEPHPRGGGSAIGSIEQGARMIEWWKNAIIYGIDVERFCDGNGDGCGDFEGLTSKLPYIAALGVTCVWLLPFFPSPNRDNGYDISDYYRIDTRFGIFEDFLRFTHEAGEQGIRVIVDLVGHHTSDQHPWFQSARHDAASPFRDYYIWSDHPPPTPAGKGPMFPGQEDSVWTFDALAGSYFYHRFYHFQPGLNHRNPCVRDELKRIMDFWMSFGISGFRIDAASHMIERPLDTDGGVDDSHGVLRDLYAHVAETKPDTVMLGEVDEDEHALKTFFDGKQLNMMFNFFLDNYMILALARGEAAPIRDALSRLPPPPESGQWANFLRNLDEADLERLEPDQMASVLSAFAPDEDMRIYGRGIRRRLAPMLGGDLARLKLAYSLLFSLPGAPMLCYGDEIGLGDDLTRKGRNAVRVPMQWTSGRHGGFSKAKKAALAQDPIADGPFGYKRINVAAQDEDGESLLAFVRRIARLRRACPAVGEQDCRTMDGGSPGVLAHAYQAPDCDLLMVHNLGDERVDTDIMMAAAMSHEGAELLGGDPAVPRDGRLRLALEPFGFRWFRWTR